MSHKSAIIHEIEELFRVPEALLHDGDAFKIVSWGACKSYVTWPDSAPEGWEYLQEETEFFVGRSGTRLVTFAADNDTYTKLYAQNDDRITEIAENICWELGLEDDNEWDEVLQ